MLRYFANGRFRRETKMLCNTRTNWEFFAVVDGRCALIFSDDERPVMCENTLWVFAPECSHAWVDDGRHDFQRIVLHFGTVPHPLDAIVREKGWFAKKLNPAEISRLKAMAEELEPHFCHPNILSPLHFQGRLMDLAALALSDHVTNQPAVRPDLSDFKVERALSWYAEHLPRNPSVKEVAEAIHVSVSHLRRLFWQVRKMSPKSSFQSIRLGKAHELMSRSSLTLDEIARNCGFASASHFCREHKSVHHFTPTFWRNKLVAGFAKPLPPGLVPTREFSARQVERTMTA